MASVKEAVRESLVGVTFDDNNLSKQVKANFLKHARKDEATGELYMNQADFVEAIAPKHEDYVSCPPMCHPQLHPVDMGE